MHGADLGYAEMQDADLAGAQMRGAEFAGSSLASADLTDVHHLTQEQLEGAVGDGETVLPRDGETGRQLFVWSCWERTHFDELAAILERSGTPGLAATFKERGTAWLCNGRPRQRTGRPGGASVPTNLRATTGCCHQTGQNRNNNAFAWTGPSRGRCFPECLAAASPHSPARAGIPD